MNEFLKKLLAKAAGFWADWSGRQKGLFIAVIAAVIVGIVMLFRVSATPVLAPVFTIPIRDETLRDRIVVRLNEEGVNPTVTPDGVIQVADPATAKRMKAILIREDLVPPNISPWQIFDTESWTITDFERNVKLQRSLTNTIVDHIKAVDGIDNVKVSIVWPEKELFKSMQNPVTASVTIIPKPGSDIIQNRKKIEGIQKTLKFAIEGLDDDHIVITDNTGLQLNDFDGMKDFDKQSLAERQHKDTMKREKEYRDRILPVLQSTFSADRVRDLSIKFDIGYNQETYKRKDILPTIIKPQTPNLPYDDSVRAIEIPLSESKSTTDWKGTGYNPEGPSGVEGQTAPAFKDMSNLYGEMNQKTETTNYDYGSQDTDGVKSPSSLDRVTVSVNIDGSWKMKYDEKKNPIVLPDNTLEREYTPVPPEVLAAATLNVQNAIGYDAKRGDSVIVTNIQVDRSEQFALEDAAYFRKKQMQTTVIVFLSGLTLLLFGFILFRMISREMERRRRLAEEERARREQMLRESMLQQADQEGTEVSISTEERTRMELMESVINMAKEHPEDAAQLLRTWLLEE
jgi:flagellar M-ring protein FliF